MEEIIIQAGIVTIQAMTIFPTILHLTACAWNVEPTPIIAVEITWVVLRGIPKCEAVKIKPAAEVSAANPCMGFSLIILCPIVFIIFQPPFIVPAAIVIAQAMITNRGISNSPVGLLWSTSPAKSARVIIPIVFWASFEPWLNAIKPDDMSCNFLNCLFTVCGFSLKIRIIHAIKSIRVNPTQNPKTGDVNIGIITLSIRVLK